MSDDARQATPHAQLIAALLDPRVQKTEREHAAAREIERLRVALVAAMEVVQKERTRIAYNAKGAPPTIAIGYDEILRRLDAVIAQADAALVYGRG